MSNEALAPDLDEARHHLRLLDSSTDKFVFQTFDDNADRKDTTLARVFSGTLEQAFTALSKLQHRGAGVFVTVNHSSNGGRKKPDIDKVRAVFREADKPGLPALPLEPHCIIESSPGKYHEYLLVDPSDDISTWDAVMTTMVEKYGSDPNAKDVSRVLRLAGFYHQKNPAAPHMVRIVHESGKPRYTLPEVAAAIPPTREKVKAAITATPSTKYGEAALARELATLAGTQKGGRNDQLNRSSFALGQLVAGRVLDRAPVEAALLGVALSIGLPQGEASATIESGMVAGSREPRTAPASEKNDRVSSYISYVSSPHTLEVASPSWPTLSRVALYGLAGDFVRAVEPHSEADPVSILGQFLACFGNVVGRHAFFKAEADQHFCNEYFVFVGRSGKARKGTSYGRCKATFEDVDGQWASERIQSGLSSGEGLIWGVRDAIERTVPVKEKGRVVDYETEVSDPGITDKRLLVVESELAATLRVTSREGNTLSAVVRQAWESGSLRVLTKNNPAKATEAHVSIIGHITKDELCRELTTTEAGNGFANRFMWFCIRRSKCLPEGGQLSDADLLPLHNRLRAAVQFARQQGEMKRDEEARAMWCEIYPALSEGYPGLLGAVTARAEAHVMRLAMMYALLDKSSVIRKPHLEAGLALWKYAEASARYIFGDNLGDPLADTLTQLLQSAPEGMSRTEISDHLQHNKSKGQIDRALATLTEYSRAEERQVDVNGRPIKKWFAISSTGYEKYEKYEKWQDAIRENSLNSCISYGNEPQNPKPLFFDLDAEEVTP